MIAALYARKSTEQVGVADEARSTTRQIEQAQAFAARHGWTVRPDLIFVDDGISGAEFDARPGLQRLLGALTPRPAFQVLILSELSRLGREQIETGAMLKRIVRAGVHVWLYLDNREVTLGSALEKVQLALSGFGDEVEREKARQRAISAATRKATAGHVTGGRVFGYHNRDVYRGTDAHGRPLRSHVVREIFEPEAAVVRSLFALAADGVGQKTIAKTLNEAGALTPRAQQGRPSLWAASSVREILFRDLYRGRVVWNRTRKRDSWGEKHRRPRLEAEWLTREAPELRLISEDLWARAHARLAERRRDYLAATGGARHGRPHFDSRHLLPGFARCAWCGGSLQIRSRSHGGHRALFYACHSYHDKGRTACRNSLEVRLDLVERAVLESLAADVLRPEITEAAVRQAVAILTAGQAPADTAALDAALADVEAECARLTEGIALGAEEPLPSLVGRLQARERDRAHLRGQIAAIEATAAVRVNVRGLVRELRDRVTAWRSLMLGSEFDMQARAYKPRDLHTRPEAHPAIVAARAFFRELLAEPIRFTPVLTGPDRGYLFEGRLALTKWITGATGCPPEVASPNGPALEGGPIFRGAARARAAA